MNHRLYFINLLIYGLIATQVTSAFKTLACKLVNRLLLLGKPANMNTIIIIMSFQNGEKKKPTNLHMDQIEEENKHMRHPWSKLYEDLGFRV
jgi:hypothetical protein